MGKLNRRNFLKSSLIGAGGTLIQKARDTLDEYQVQANPCEGCSECMVKCSKGFPVAERIRNVCRLIDVPEEFIV